jgi:uncharacterized membrane protein
MKRALPLLAAALVVAGVYFRVAHLDRKVFWLDETHTGLWISGLTRGDFAREAAEKRLYAPADLARYRTVDPARGLGATVRYLAAEAPQHPPLFGILEHLWASTFGDSIASLRALPALLGILGIALMAWLARELFGTGEAAPIAAALFAISPFHVLYAQEARPYSLYTAATLLSSAALLRALRLRTGASFAAYAATAALGLYSHLFFAFVLAGHGLYILAVEGLRRALLGWLAAVTGALIAFEPWAHVIARNFPAVRWGTGWLDWSLGARGWIHGVALNLGAPFIDLEGHHIVPALPVALLLAGALAVLARTRPRREWSFPVALGAPVVIALAIADAALGGQRCTVSRYFVPAQAAAVLLAAGLLATGLGARECLRRGALGAVAALLVVAGLVSCAQSDAAETRWTKGYPGERDRETARIVARAERPVVLVEVGDVGEAITLSLDAGGAARFLFADASGFPEDALARFATVFVVFPTPELEARLGALG